MKKFLFGLLLYFIFLIFYFLQANFFNWFTIAGVSPNIFIILILFLGLFTDNRFSLILSLLIGVTLDLFVGKSLGVTAVTFCLIALVCRYFDRNFSKDNKLSILILIVGLTIVCEVITYFLNCLILEIDIEIVPFIRILAIEVLYNAILTFIFYNLILKLGAMLERQFKQRNILTRYF